jgi:hypothetical protein
MILFYLKVYIGFSILFFSWQKNQTQALGLRLLGNLPLAWWDGFYCSNTVLGECCARQVRTYSSQKPFPNLRHAHFKAVVPFYNHFAA